MQKIKPKISFSTVSLPHGMAYWPYLFFISIALLSKPAIAAQQLSFPLKPLRSASFYYSIQTSKFWLFSQEKKLGDLKLGFSGDTLTEWKSSNVNAFSSGLAVPKRKWITFGEDTYCSVGFVDDSANCFISELTVNYTPVYVIRDFNRTNDVAMVFIEQTYRNPTKQLLVYRPGIGTIYMRQFTKFPELNITRFEVVLDSFAQNESRFLFLKKNQVNQLRSGSDKMKDWILRLEYNDIIGPTRHLHWNQLIF